MNPMCCRESMTLIKAGLLIMLLVILRFGNNIDSVPTSMLQKYYTGTYINELLQVIHP